MLLRRLLPTALAALLTACAAPPVPLTPVAQARLAELGEGDGELVYEGEVTPIGAEAPAFRYERRVAGPASTHLTYDRAGALLVAQRADHGADYRLSRYEEVHAQTGTASRVEVADDGSLHFRRKRGDDVDETEEGPGAPAVVGPTLFGFTLAHLDELRRGETLDVRFASAERGESYGFTLALEEETDEAIVIAFVAGSPFVRLVMDPMRIVFARGGNAVLSYRGRVPPRLAGAEIDAEVTYRMHGPFR